MTWSSADPPADAAKFFIVVDGQDAKVYNPDDPPAIVTTKGSVEDWTIENRTFEVHDFHIHQIHFLVLEVNGTPVPRSGWISGGQSLAILFITATSSIMKIGA